MSFRDDLAAASDFAASYLETVRERPVVPPVRPGEIRLAVERASASDRLRAERYVADLEQLAGGEFDDRDLIALDYRCHSFVYRCTKNRFFERTLVRYLNQATRLWYVYLDAIAYARSDDDQRRPIEDLKTLLTALAAGDAEAAATVAQTHVRRSHSAVIGPLVPDARLNAVQ